MRGFVKFGSVFCLMAMMSACTTTRAYNHIDAEARPHIQEMDSVLLPKQKHVRADINTSKLSQYIQGHFAPVLFDLAVNGIRTHQATKIMAPIDRKLIDYDYTQDIHEEFTQALGETELADMGELLIMREEEQGFRAAYVKRSEADAVMFIDVDFAFTPSFDALELISHVMVFPVDEALSPYKETPDTDEILEFEDNIYRNQFMAAIPSGAGEDSSKSENGIAWAQRSKEELTALMQEAAQKLADHIAKDLTTDDLPEEGNDPEEPPADVPAEIASETIEAATDPALAKANG